jgi:very-short-patch-repair endonuclease
MSFDRQKEKDSIYVNKKDYQDRKRASESGDPEACFDSMSERRVYCLFRDFCVLPITQYNIGKYFIDFAFPVHKIGVEFDGPEHENQKERDLEREEYIRSQGWDVVRIMRRNSFLKYEIVVNQENHGHYRTMKMAVNVIANRIRELNGKGPIDCFPEAEDDNNEENEENLLYWTDKNGVKYYS